MRHSAVLALVANFVFQAVLASSPASADTAAQLAFEAPVIVGHTVGTYDGHQVWHVNVDGMPDEDVGTVLRTVEVSYYPSSPGSQTC